MKGLHRKEHMNDCKKPIDVQYIGNLPIDAIEELPDYFLAERDLLDASTGETKRTMVRVPSLKLFPTVSMDNVFALESNNEGIVIPENQVRAVYISNQGSANVMEYADATHPAIMLAIGEVAGMILCQNSGVVNLAKGHQYVVGQQYYTGANGEPVTDDTSEQKLFIPISSTKLLVNL